MHPNTRSVVGVTSLGMLSNMTITETIEKNGRIDNDFDHKRAKVELGRLARIIATGCCASSGCAQKLSDAISDYERRTMDSPFST